MTYNNDSPVEITLGVCDNCSSYVPFVRLVTEDDKRIYQCMTCKAKHTQHIKTKVSQERIVTKHKLKKRYPNYCSMSSKKSRSSSTSRIVAKQGKHSFSSVGNRKNNSN